MGDLLTILLTIIAVVFLAFLSIGISKLFEKILDFGLKKFAKHHSEVMNLIQKETDEYISTLDALFPMRQVHAQIYELRNMLSTATNKERELYSEQIEKLESEYAQWKKEEARRYESCQKCHDDVSRVFRCLTSKEKKIISKYFWSPSRVYAKNTEEHLVDNLIR